MGRLRGFLWLIAGLAVALLGGIVAYMTLSRAALQAGGEDSATPKVWVVVSAGAIPARSVLGAENLEVRSMPVELVPEGAISGAAEAEGKVTMVDLHPGEMILTQRLLDPNIISGDGRKALVLQEDKVLMAMPAGDLMGRAGVLKAGDHVDILISLEMSDESTQEPYADALEGPPASSSGVGDDAELVTFTVLENIEIAGIVGEGGGAAAPESGFGPTSSGSSKAPEAILVTVRAQDALVLKYALDADGIQDIVLRAPGIERPFPIEPVDALYLIKRYQIPIGPLN